MGVLTQGEIKEKERTNNIKLINTTANACRERSKYNVKICNTAGCRMILYCRAMILKELDLWGDEMRKKMERGG